MKSIAWRISFENIAVFTQKRNVTNATVCLLSIDKMVLKPQKMKDASLAQVQQYYLTIHAYNGNIE